MQHALTTELFWLTLTVLLTALLWLPYIANQLLSMGIWPALKSYSPETIKKGTWVYRAFRSHMNAVENLIVFAPLVLMLHVTGKSTALTGTACMIYFFARAAHSVIYIAGIPVLRTLAFAVGFVVQILLALTLLGAL